MFKNKSTGFLRAMVFVFVLFFPFHVYATPGVAIVSRGVENAYGELPEADGYIDTSLQDRVNGQLRSAANELKNVVKGKPDVNYSYEIIKNKANFVSVIIKADSKGIFLDSRSVNLDPRTGNPFVLNELFIANEHFFAALEEELGWQPEEKTSFGLGEQGLVLVRPTDGQTVLVAFDKIFNWVDVGKSVYYLDSYYITEAADGKLLRVKQGNLVVLRLESNKSSGYVWQSMDTDYEPVLKYMGSSYLISSAAIGANGWDLLIYGAQQPGEAYINMEYKRPWQNQIVRTVKVQIVIE